MILIVLLAACNLAESTDEESLETPIAVAVTVQPTVSNDPTSTPDNEVAGSDSDVDESVGSAVELEVVPINTNNTANNASASNNASGCSLRTDLPMYTVVSGDTLFSIATRYDSTVADLSAYNCLTDDNVISVGQNLYVPADNVSTSNIATTVNTNTNRSSTVNTVVTGEFVPVIDSYASFDGTTYTVYEGRGFTVSLPSEGLDERLTQLEFVYTDDRTEYTSVWMGTDNDLSDGVSLFWLPDGDLQGTIVIDGRIPGQMHEVFSSEPIRVESESPLISPVGEITIVPNEQAGSTTDGSTPHVLTAGETVTITWLNIDTSYTDQVNVANVNFFYYPATGGITPIGTDSNIDDGISITWVVPDRTFGGLAASVTILNGSTLISPRLQVQAGITDVMPCEFVAYGIGGPVPVYGIPNTAVETIRMMTANETAPVLGIGGTWQTEFGGSGTFYHLDFGTVSGWVRDVRGGLQGDCADWLE